ncbi:GlxA family transcriptional regulator [Desulfobacula toluolica]|uniref:Putative transcriptional regulator, AraC type n=1 Tax=Desulfobacula toluolica (strain DSM 7467 / Tol2) TaxID=651182 RepID=K0NH85_DESTT|nr:helix-turn-helix domain-containing protein [Desulfobacula toluolica]CCK78367.1 putative transcriptional regulator, AraC type [Desulfobacula toluolica Tol2]
MIKITILALDNVLASSVMGTMDTFGQTGVTWNFIVGHDEVSYFDINIVTQDGKPVKTRHQAAIYPNGSIQDIESTDLIMISSFSDYKTIETSGKAIEWLREQNKKGTTIAGICAGAYILAETGLLNGKTATTHWGFANDFRKRYPQINLQSEKIITDEGNLLCSGGCNSYIDLSIYLIERYCGQSIALESSKAMLHDIGRNSQKPYTVFQFAKDHADSKIKLIQIWFEENYNQRIDIGVLAKNFGLSRRVLERRFNAATGNTPLLYLQRLRVEIAKNLLEKTSKTFSEIAFFVGYEDTSFFRKIFKKHTKLLPKEYKTKFFRAIEVLPGH